MKVPAWLTRDAIVTGVALALLIGEVAIFGARPSVLTTLLALLSGPLALRLDAFRRKNGNG